MISNDPILQLVENVKARVMTVHEVGGIAQINYMCCLARRGRVESAFSYLNRLRYTYPGAFYRHIAWLERVVLKKVQPWYGSADTLLYR